MHHLTGQIIVATHDGIRFRDNIHMVIDIGRCELRFPSVRMHGIQDCHLMILHHLPESFLYHSHVAVHRRTSQHQHFSTRQPVIHQCFSHHGADALVVESDIQINIRIHDHSVVGDDFNPCFLRLLHLLCQPLGINADDDNNVHSLINEIIDLFLLLFQIPVGILYIDLRPQFLGCGYEDIPVCLPPLDDKRIEAHADLDLPVLCGIPGRFTAVQITAGAECQHTDKHNRCIFPHFFHFTHCPVHIFFPDSPYRPSE